MIKNRFKNLFYVSIAITAVAVFGFVLPVRAQNVAISFNPASKAFDVGEQFSIDMVLETETTVVNVIQADIYFPASLISVIDIDKNEAVFPLWQKEPVVSDIEEKISFVVGVPQGGFLGKDKIITINFIANQTGDFDLNFGSAKVLASDGYGTDVLDVIRDGKYIIYGAYSDSGLPLASQPDTGESPDIPIEEPPVVEELAPEIQPDEPDQEDIVSAEPPDAPVIFSKTHLKNDEWYSNNNIEFNWQISENITGISFVFNQYPFSIPDAISEPLSDNKAFSDINDGIWYFHLRTANQAGWSDTSHYKVKIDNSPPESFDFAVDNKGDLTNPFQQVYFSSQDNLSGVDYYKIKIGDKEFIKIMPEQANPFALPYYGPGVFPLVARAYDKAGNSIESRTILTIEPIQTPEIITMTSEYSPGKVPLYIAGLTEPDSQVEIFLEKDNKEQASWQVLSNSAGEWIFSTGEFFNTGQYYIFARAKDKRGALSQFSKKHSIDIVFSGLVIGGLRASFRTMATVLGTIFFFEVLFILFCVFKTRRTKKKLMKEIKEAEQQAKFSFNNLRRSVENRIEMFDLKPGFTPREKKLYYALKKDLDSSEKAIHKEIKDIEQELK